MDVAVVTSVKQTGRGAKLTDVSPRRGVLIYNDADAPLLVRFGGPAKSDDFSLRLEPHAFLGPQGVSYDGEIWGVWASGGSGFARVTELRVE